MENNQITGTIYELIRLGKLYEENNMNKELCADYYFAALCYCELCPSEVTANFLAERIKKITKKYNPKERFKAIEKPSLEEITYKLPVMKKMNEINNYCTNFSIEAIVKKYF